LSLSAALLERRDDGCRSCGFFFQAEDGIRDFHVTGVQTCALPISSRIPSLQHHFFSLMSREIQEDRALHMLLSKKSADDRIASQIGRASCRERVSSSVGAVSLTKRNERGRETRVSRSSRNVHDATR